MKILVVGSRIPWPLHDGGAIATYQLLKGLLDQGAEVVYFSFNTRKHFVDREQIERHFPFCKVVDIPLDANPTITGALLALLQGKNYNISRFENETAKRRFADLLSSETFDLVQLEGLYASPFLDVVTEAGIPVVLRQHNAEFQIWERLAKKERNPLKSLYYRILSAQLKTYETGILRRVQAIVPISPADRDLFTALAPGKPMYLLPVGLTEAITDRPAFRPETFFHLGSMEWIPNVEAVKWLVHEVWPLVRSALPEAKLHLAGKGLQKQDNRFSGPGITVEGEIDNAQHFMQSHGVMLVPVFAAGGIRVKILEAFNLGVPVVSTDIGVQGIHAANEKELLLANTAREFATAMIRMQQEPARRESMVANSRSLIDREYQVGKLISGLLDFYRQILDSTQFKD